MLTRVTQPLSSGTVFPWLTADRIVGTSSTSSLETPAALSTDQSITQTGTATLTTAGLITAQSGLQVNSNSAVTGTETVTGLLTASSALTVGSTTTLSALTASRLTRTNSSKQLESNAALTNTHVLYADSNGWPTGSASLTFSGTLLTLGTGASGGLTIAATTGTTLTVSSTTDSTSKDTGSIVTEGGIGVEKAVVAGTGFGVGTTPSSVNPFVCTASANSAVFFSSTNSNSGTGAQCLYKAFNDSGSVAQYGMTSSGFTAYGALVASAGQLYCNSSAGIVFMADNASGQIVFASGGNTARLTISSAGVVTVSNTTDSTSKDTGSIVTEGGIGVEKSVYAGGGLNAGAASAISYSSAVFTVGNGSGAPTFKIDGASGNARSMSYYTGGSIRWNFQCTSGAETGSDAGSAFALSAYTDAGAYIDDPINVARASGGRITFSRRAVVIATSSVSGTTFGSFVVGDQSTSGTNVSIGQGAILAGASIRSLSATDGVGYATGAGGTVTQITSRTTGVTLNKVCGQITLFSAAGSTSWTSFTVTNSAVATTDVIRVCQDSGTDKYQIHVTAVGAGSFEITFATTGGTTVEQPVFNFAVIKAVTA